MTTVERTVLVASSDRLFAEAAGGYAHRRDGWRTVGVVTDGLQLLDAVRRRGPSAVLIIGDLRRLGPSAVAQEIGRRWPRVVVVVVGGASGDAAIQLPSDVGASAVFDALDAPLAAEVGPRAAGTGARSDGVNRLKRLTATERRVLRMLVDGRRMVEISVTMGVSPHTVRTHVQNIYAKLDLHSRVELVRFAARHGLVSAETAGRGA